MQLVWSLNLQAAWNPCAWEITATTIYQPWGCVKPPLFGDHSCHNLLTSGLNESLGTRISQLLQSPNAGDFMQPWGWETMAAVISQPLELQRMAWSKFRNHTGCLLAVVVGLQSVIVTHSRSLGLDTGEGPWWQQRVWGICLTADQGWLLLGCDQLPSEISDMLGGMLECPLPSGLGPWRHLHDPPPPPKHKCMFH